VLQRRLAQRYRDTRLAAALSLGTVAGTRRNERLLLASFTNTQQLAPWLDALEEAGTKLTGVYSVPLLAPALARKLGAKGGRAFVVTVNRAGFAAVLHRGRPAAVRAPGTHRGHGAAGARHLRALRDAAARASTSAHCACFPA